MICWLIFHWISDGFWSHFWCFFNTFTIRTCNLLNHQKPLFSNEFLWFYSSEKHDFWWFSWSFPLPVLAFFFRAKGRQMDPTKDQNGTKNHPNAGFLRFWGVLGGGVFSTFLGTGKLQPKIQKNPILWSETGARTPKMGRPGGMRGASGEVRRGSEPLLVWQDPD